MNPSELALIRFLAASLAFIKLNPYILSEDVCYLGWGILQIFLNSQREDRHMGEGNHVAESQLSFLNGNFTIFNLRYFSKRLKKT